MTGFGGRARRAAVAVACLAASAALGPLGAPAAGAAAAAWSSGPCPGADGVTVVVDFQQLGGGTVVRCAEGAVSSGVDALQKAGFSVNPVKNQPFVCQIDGKPESACLATPPTSAYWGYWIAARGGEWCYSQRGPSRKPPQGTVEGWSFSQGHAEDSAPPPRVAPPAWVAGAPTSVQGGACPAPSTTTAPPAPATTAPPAPATTAPAGPGGGAEDVGRGGSSGSPTTARAGDAPAVDGATTTSALGDGASTTSSPPSTSTTMLAGELEVRDGHGSSPAGAIAGGAAVAGLGLAAVLTARRRRRAPDPGPDDPDDPGALAP